MFREAADGDIKRINGHCFQLHSTLHWWRCPQEGCPVFPQSQIDLLIFKGLRNPVVRELRKAKTAYFMQLRNLKETAHPYGSTLTVLLNSNLVNKKQKQIWKWMVLSALTIQLLQNNWLSSLFTQWRSLQRILNQQPYHRPQSRSHQRFSKLRRSVRKKYII